MTRESKGKVKEGRGWKNVRYLHICKKSCNFAADYEITNMIGKL